MKKICLLAAVLLFLALPAEAVQIGPATPAAADGQTTLALGYDYRNLTFDNGWQPIQHRLYLQLGYGMGHQDEPKWEVLLRAGAANLTAGVFADGAMPFAGIGLKGELLRGSVLAWGLTVQGNYFATYEDSSIDMKIQDLWEMETAFPVQAGWGPMLLYLGPVVYQSQAEFVRGVKKKTNSEGNFGAFAGGRLQLPGLWVDLEGQYKEDFSGNILFTLPF